jgi:hypothetical protein
MDAQPSGPEFGQVGWNVDVNNPVAGPLALIGSETAGLDEESWSLGTLGGSDFGAMFDQDVDPNDVGDLDINAGGGLL